MHYQCGRNVEENQVYVKEKLKANKAIQKQMATQYKKHSSYKDSGVEWLGMVPEHWEVERLKFLGNIFAGLAGKKGDDFSKKINYEMKPFVPFTNICNNNRIDTAQYQYVKIAKNEVQNIIRKNDILFLMSSETLNEIAKNSIYKGDDNELYLNSFCKGFRLKDKRTFPEYINYLFLSKTYRNYFSTVARGFTSINLKQEYINDAYTLLPPIQEQIAIANFLDQKTTQIDRAIELKEQTIALLKERKQIVIQELVTGKWRIENGELKMRDKAELKDSGVEWIGEVPKEWEVKALKYIAY